MTGRDVRLLLVLRLVFVLVTAGDALQLVFRQFGLAALDQSVGRSRFLVAGSRLLVGLDVPCRHIAFLLLRSALAVLLPSTSASGEAGFSVPLPLDGACGDRRFLRRLRGLGSRPHRSESARDRV